MEHRVGRTREMCVMGREWEFPKGGKDLGHHVEGLDFYCKNLM